MTPWSAPAATASPAGKSSASPSPGPCYGTRGSWCSTRRPARWTPRPSGPCRRRSTTWPGAGPPSPSRTASPPGATRTRSSCLTTARSSRPGTTSAWSPRRAVTPSSPPSPSAGHVDELELDVVRVAEHHDRVGHRFVGVDRAGVRDAEGIEPADPGVEVSTFGHPEGDVVQAGAVLLEGLTWIVLMVVQADGDARARLHQQDRVAALLVAVMRERDRYPAHREDPLVPLGARLHVRHGRREVIEPRDGRCGAAAGRGAAVGQGNLLCRPCPAPRAGRAAGRLMMTMMPASLRRGYC